MVEIVKLDPGAYADPKPESGLAKLDLSVAGVFALCLSLAVLVRYNGLFPSVIDWDESLYAVMAQDWLNGGLPYKSVWDHHSVGLPALYAAILYVFPDSLIAIRLSGCVAVAITATTIYFTARAIDRGGPSPIVAALLYIAWTSRLWGLPSNTELYLNTCMTLAMVVAMRAIASPPHQAPRLGLLCFASLLLGFALQIKHVAVFETFLFFITMLAVSLRDSWRSALKTLIATGTCFLLPSIGIVLYFYQQDLANEYFQTVVVANFVYATNRPDVLQILMLLRPISFGLPLIIIIAAAALLWRQFDRRILLIVAWAIAAIIDVTLPGKFWPHYFLLMMPPAAILGGHVAATLYQRVKLRQKQWLIVLAMFAVFGYPSGVYVDAMKAQKFTEHDAPAVISDRIRGNLSPDASVFVFNYQPVIYFLTGAALPTRHVFPADWAKVYSAMTGLDPVRELDQVFQVRPEYVVFVDEDWVEMGGDVLEALHRHLAVDYEKDFDVVDIWLNPTPTKVEVYRRKVAQDGSDQAL
jgi:hypothetical protein